jgi:hypothetical protein
MRQLLSRCVASAIPASFFAELFVLSRADWGQNVNSRRVVCHVIRIKELTESFKAWAAGGISRNAHCRKKGNLERKDSRLWKCINA